MVGHGHCPRSHSGGTAGYALSPGEVTGLGSTAQQDCRLLSMATLFNRLVSEAAQGHSLFMLPGYTRPKAMVSSWAGLGL